MSGCRFDLWATKWSSTSRRPLDRRRLELLLGIPVVMHHLVQHETRHSPDGEAFTRSALGFGIPLRRRQIRECLTEPTGVGRHRLGDEDRLLFVVPAVDDRGIVIPPAELLAGGRCRSVDALLEDGEHIAGVAGVFERTPHIGCRPTSKVGDIGGGEGPAPSSGDIGQGAGKVGVGVGRAVEGTGAGDLARRDIVLPDATAETATTTFADSATGTVSAEPFDIPGLSSWITPSTDDQFYRIDSALSFPQIDPATWQLSFTGMVDNPYELTYDEILGMDLVERTITLACVSNPIGGDYVGNAVWTGIPLADLLDRAGVQDGATQIVGRSVDDFTGGFPTETAYDGRNAMLVVGQNGEPLQVRHGFPARLVVAGLYGYVSATKWIEEINLTTWEAFNGYWIDLGWSKNGPMKTASRIDVPQHRSRITAGTTPIAGVAWSPVRGIQAVEISIDEGPWQDCDLAVPGTDESWVQWKADWNASPGVHRIDVRAIDKHGEIQPVGPKDIAPDGAEGYHAILVEVVA